MDFVGKPNTKPPIWNHCHSCHPSAFVQVSSSSRDRKRPTGQVCIGEAFSKLAKFERDRGKWEMLTRNMATYAAIPIPQRCVYIYKYISQHRATGDSWSITTVVVKICHRHSPSIWCVPDWDTNLIDREPFLPNSSRTSNEIFFSPPVELQIKVYFLIINALLNYPLLSAVYGAPRSPATKLLTWSEIQMYYFSSTPFSPSMLLTQYKACCLQPLTFIILRCFVQRPEHLN